MGKGKGKARGASMMLTLRDILLLYGFSLMYEKPDKLQKIEIIADRFLSTLFDIILLSSNMNWYPESIRKDVYPMWRKRPMPLVARWDGVMSPNNI